MPYLIDKLEDLTGETLTGEGRLVGQLLSAGADLVSNVIGADERSHVTLAIASSPVALNGKRVVTVERSGVPARQISPTQAARGADTASLFYRGAQTPAYYIKDDQITLVPDGSGVAYVLGSFDVQPTDETISGFPAEAVHAVLLYAAGRYLLKLSHASVAAFTYDYDQTEIDALLTALAALATDYTWSTVNLNLPPLNLGSLSFIPTVPSYVAPAVTMPTPPTLSDLDLTLVTAPSAPGASTITAGSVSAPTKPTLTATSASTIGAVADPPAWSTQSMTPPTPPTLGTGPDFTGITAPGTAPSAPTLSFSSATAGTITLPTPAPTLGTAPTYDGPDPDDLADQPFTYDKTVAWTTRMADDDPEMVQAAMQEILAQIQEHRTQIEEAQAKFNAEVQIWIKQYEDDLAEYQAGVQKAIRDAELETEVSIANASGIELAKAQAYAAEVQGYLGEVNAYRAEINAAIERWAAEIDREIRLYEVAYVQTVAEYAQDIAQENARVSNEVAEHSNKIQSAIAQLQTTLQEALANKQGADANEQAHAQRTLQASIDTATRTLQADIQTDVLNLQRYQQQVQEWQIEINKAVQVWLTEEVQGWIGLYQAEWQATLGEYNAEIQNAVSTFTSALQAEQYKWTQELQEYQANQQADVTEAEFLLQETINDVRVSVEQQAAEAQVQEQTFRRKFDQILQQIGTHFQTWANEIQQNSLDLQRQQGNRERYLAASRVMSEQFMIELTMLTQRAPLQLGGQQQ